MGEVRKRKFYVPRFVAYNKCVLEYVNTKRIEQQHPSFLPPIYFQLVNCICAFTHPMTPYPYQPLNLPRETRILTIFPGKREDALTCSLSHLDIQCGDAYDALSYCWSKSITSLADALDADAEITMTDDADSGVEARQLKVRELLSDPQYRHLYVLLGATLPEGSIFCDGLEMTVGGELFSALEWMRDETETRRLWVDALCINQNDMQERNEHVKVMGSIYANASVVRVWLGNEIGVEEDAFRALKELDKLLTDIWDDLKDASFAETPAIFQSHPQWYTIEWDAVAKFLGRAWVCIPACLHSPKALMDKTTASLLIMLIVERRASIVRAHLGRARNSQRQGGYRLQRRFFGTVEFFIQHPLSPSELQAKQSH